MAIRRSRPAAPRTANRRAQRALPSRKQQAPDAHPATGRIELTVTHQPLQFRWAEAISEAQWSIYRGAIEAVRQAGIAFMLGGGFALAAYTGRWRDTKDIDLYIHPGDREATVAALTQAGYEDYFPCLPYDRKWIYRSTKADVIVDIIWSMANQRAQVDPIWFERAGQLAIRSQQLSIIPAEEFMWCKLYIMQRDHCDWTDLFNLLYAHGDQIDWEHLIGRLQDDTPLLKGLLTVYGWLCPKDVHKLPAQLWERLEMPAPVLESSPPGRDRLRLLDSRRWFAALLPQGEKLEI